MTKRMTDERLAEIETMRMRCVPMIEGTDVLPASSELSEELLQALKAERELIAEKQREAIGCTYAAMCTYAMNGRDITEVEFPEIAEGVCRALGIK